MFPLHLLSSVFRFIFGVLRLPLPHLRFTGLSFYRPLRRPRPTSRGGADRWVRELEEETGALCVGRSPAAQGTTSAVDAGPSSLSARTPTVSGNGTVEDERKILPNFTLGTYEETLRMCQREMRIGCVVLVSEEHDDVAEFKRFAPLAPHLNSTDGIRRSTLTNPEFVDILSDNDIIVWGGDVRDQEAWSGMLSTPLPSLFLPHLPPSLKAAEKLQATTFPFVAFIALQPRRSPLASNTTATPSTSPPTLTVLSRHQGPPSPSTAPTSAHALTTHLTHQLLPRVSPFLERLRHAHRERERDRALRAEQDAAFRDSARRDKERIEEKMRADLEEEERLRRAEAEAREAAVRREREEAEKVRREEQRMAWRRWGRRVVGSTGSAEGGAGEGEGALRIAVRMPSGGRIVRRFGETDTLTALYTVVDAQLIPPHLKPEDDPIFPPGESSPEGGLEGIEMQVMGGAAAADWWGFTMALAYPRKEITWAPGVTLGTVDGLSGGAQLVVEMVGDGRRGSRERTPEKEEGTHEDDDGYSTEDSE